MDITLSLAELALLDELMLQSCVNPDEAEPCKALRGILSWTQWAAVEGF